MFDRENIEGYEYQSVEDYEYEQVINSYDGTILCLTEDNQIYHRDQEGKEHIYNYKKGKLKESEGEVTVKKDYQWTELKEPKKENDTLRNLYQSIIKRSPNGSKFDLLNMYDDTIELYAHFKGEGVAHIYHYDGKELDDIEVLPVHNGIEIPFFDRQYSYILYTPYSNTLKTIYYRKKLGIVRNNVIQKYSIKNGKWEIQGLKNIDNRILFYQHYSKYIYDDEFNDDVSDEEYFSHLQEDTGEKFVEERSKEDILYMLEKY